MQTKSQVKHTPGPWKYNRTHRMSEDQWFVITNAAGYGPVVDVGGKDYNGQIAEAKYLVTDPEEIEANARLIAAAPKLLAALKIAIEYIPQEGDDDLDSYERAEEAIREAEGR